MNPVFPLFWEHGPIPRIGNFLRHFFTKLGKFTLYNLIKQNKKNLNIWFTNKHISKFGKQKKYNLLWHSAIKMLQNSDMFLFLELGFSP